MRFVCPILLAVLLTASPGLAFAASPDLPPKTLRHHAKKPRQNVARAVESPETWQWPSGWRLLGWGQSPRTLAAGPVGARKFTRKRQAKVAAPGKHKGEPFVWAPSTPIRGSRQWDAEEAERKRLDEQLDRSMKSICRNC